MDRWRVGPSRVHVTGMFATRNLHAGERISTEKSLLEYDSKQNIGHGNAKMLHDIRNLSNDGKDTLRLQVKAQNPVYSAMTFEMFKEWLDAPHSEFEERLVDTFFYNAYPFAESATAPVFRSFRTISLLNHSCDPNADASWNPETGRINVYAIEDISAGSEIFISYIDHFNSGGDRRKLLGFDCRCECCCKTGGARQHFERAWCDMGIAFKILQAFWAEYLPRGGGDVQLANLRGIRQRAPFYEMHQAFEAADYIQNTALNMEMSHSRFAVASEFLYISAAMDTAVNESKVDLYHAFEQKSNELLILGVSMGVAHPRSQRVVRQLLRFRTKGDGKIGRIAQILQTFNSNIKWSKMHNAWAVVD